MFFFYVQRARTWFSAYHKCNTLFHWLEKHQVEVAILRYMHERALSRNMDRFIPRYIVPDTEMDVKVLRKMTVNNNCNRLFHFCTNDIYVFRRHLFIVLKKYGHVVADLL